MNKKQLAILKKQYKNDPTLLRYWLQMSNLHIKNVPVNFRHVAFGNLVPEYETAIEHKKIKLADEISQYIKKNYPELIYPC